MFPPRILLGALINFCKENTLKIKVSPHSYKATLQLSTENGNQFTVVAQVLKVLSRQQIAENRDKFVDGDDSSDSDGMYEDPSTAAKTSEEDTGVEGKQHQTYCMEFRKKKGPLPDFLEWFRSFKHECNLLSNAESTSNLMESQSGF